MQADLFDPQSVLDMQARNAALAADRPIPAAAGNPNNPWSTLGPNNPTAKPPSSLRSVTNKMQQVFDSPSYKEGIATAKGAGGKVMSVGGTTLKGIPWAANGLAKFAGPAMGLSDLYEAGKDFANGRYGPYVDENNAVQSGAGINSAKALAQFASLAGSEVGMPLIAQPLIGAADHFASNALLSDEDKAKLANAPGNQPGGVAQADASAANPQPADAQPTPSGVGDQPASGSKDYIQSMLGDLQSAKAYRDATDLESPQRKQLVESAANPNEEYAPYQGQNLDLSARQKLQDQFDKYMSLPDAPASLRDWGNGNYKHRGTLQALTSAMEQFGGLSQKEAENVRMQHGYDKRNTIDLHQADQTAGIQREQNRVAGLGSVLGRMTAAQQFQLDRQKANWDRQQGNVAERLRFLEKVYPNDPVGLANALRTDATRNDRGADGQPLGPEDSVALTSGGIAKTESRGVAQRNLPFYSSDTTTPSGVGLKSVPLSSSGVGNEIFGHKVSPLTAVARYAKGVVNIGNSKYVETQDGQHIPIEEYPAELRQAHALKLKQQIDSGQLKGDAARRAQIDIDALTKGVR